MSSTDKHTPGPWMWGTEFSKLGRGDEEIPKFANCCLCGPDGQDIIPIRIDHGEPLWDIDPGAWNGVFPTKADRDLIAAAPDLLEACRKALSEYSTHDQGTIDTRMALRAAIAKATGG